LSGEPLWVQGDATRLEQVAVNLIGNASKYTSAEGEIRLTLQQEGDEVVFRVHDSGIGISPSVLPRIFDLFVQADSSLDRSQGGLGIGLALVKSLVELHSGRVEVNSTVGKGSEFIVRLPRPLAPGANPVLSAEAPAVPVHGLRILVVDDNVDAASSMCLLLEMHGHTSSVAHDSLRALEMIWQHVPDVVLLDIGLPVLDGYQVAQRIRADASLSKVVVIALTGYGTQIDRNRSKEAGFHHHLVKPVDFGSLEKILTLIAAA
jgi:CheY-like chemotaxis protein